MIPRLLLLPYLFLIAAPVQASDFESDVLFRKGAWEVEVTYSYRSGDFWCNASTYNRSGQSFNIVAYDSRDLAMVIADTGWDLSPRDVRFFVDIDYSRWTIDGSAGNSSVSVFMNEAEKAIRFLSELQEGNAVAVYNERNSRIATFSLSGSYAAVVSLFDCWSKIAPDDPLENPSDPFGGSSDPF